MDGWMDVQMGVWIDGWMDGWMVGGWMDGWMDDKWMDGWASRREGCRLWFQINHTHVIIPHKLPHHRACSKSLPPLPCGFFPLH
jgi:hypothetical protein